MNHTRWPPSKVWASAHTLLASCLVRNQAYSGTADATRTERRFTRRGMGYPLLRGYSNGQEWADCKIVGSAYVGSNLTPATR